MWQLNWRSYKSTRDFYQATMWTRNGIRCLCLYNTTTWHNVFGDFKSNQFRAARRDAAVKCFWFYLQVKLNQLTVVLGKVWMWIIIKTRNHANLMGFWVVDKEESRLGFMRWVGNSSMSILVFRFPVEIISVFTATLLLNSKRLRSGA